MTTQDGSRDGTRSFNRFARRTRRFGIALLAIGVIAVAITLVAGSVAQARLLAEHPAPGRLIDVGGRALHLHCIGDGAPTVIMDAGLMDFSVQWAEVQSRVARFTRACTYDRAGLGWSDAGPEPRTSATMVADLRTLLAKANVDGPYLLVGHSFGGVNMRLFAHQHPAGVAGMVLVDSAHEDQTVRLPALLTAAEAARNQFRALAPLSTLGLMALDLETIPTRGLPPHAAQQYRAVLASSGYFQAAIAEAEGMEASYEEARAAGMTDLGDLPLVVISRGLGDPIVGLSEVEQRAYELEWQRMQAELLDLSTTATHVVARESGHYVQLEQPDLVVEAIRTLVDAVRP